MPAAAVAGHLDALATLAPLVAEHRAAFDRERCLPRPVFEALAKAGLFRLWLPRALGGAELSAPEFMAVVEAAAALDGTVGWLVGNGGGAARFGGLVPEDVARAWFDDPHAFCVAVTGAVGQAVPAPGGYTVSGRWPFASGIHHGNGVVALCAVAGTEPPRLLLCQLPRAAVEVHDSWHVSGLRGTGSCDISAREVPVPEAQCLPFTEPRPCQPGALYAVPAAITFPPCVAAVPLGIAAGALADFAAQAGRSRGGISQPLRERELVQHEYGRAGAIHGAARAFLAEALDGLLPGVRQGGEASIAARVKARQAYAHAATAAREVMAILTGLAGAISIFESAPLERRQRDLVAATQHIAVGANNYIVAGRVGLGVELGAARL